MHYQRGRTPVTHAADIGHLEALEELLAAGATPAGFGNTTAKLMVALRGAARNGNLGPVYALIDQGADLSTLMETVSDSTCTNHNRLECSSKYRHCRKHRQL
jgi:hypothetical protein